MSNFGLVRPFNPRGINNRPALPLSVGAQSRTATPDADLGMHRHSCLTIPLA